MSVLETEKQSHSERELACAQERLEREREREERQGARGIGSIIHALRRKLGLDRPNGLATVREAWEQVLPEAIQTQTRVVSFRNGVLTVETSNVTWKSQTEMFHKQALLDSLRPLLPPNVKLRDIRFRVASGVETGPEEGT